MILYRYRAAITRVVDGDTVVADIDLGCKVWLRGEHLRLTGIDAPEPHTETREAGLAAAKALADMIEGKEVIIETFKVGRGKFGRYGAVIWLGDININERMVATDHAVAD